MGLRAVLVVAGLLLAACGSTENASPTTSAPSTTAPTAPEDATTPSAPGSANGSPAMSPTSVREAESGSRKGEGGATTTTTPRATVNAASASAGCPATPPRTPPRADRPRYTLHVDVRLGENAVVGDISARFTPDLDTDRLVLRLWPNGPRSSGAGARLDIGTLRVDGKTVPAKVENATTLVARPEGGVKAGRAVQVDLPWRLTLPGSTSDRISRAGDAVRMGSFFPILAWEPGVGWATEPPTGAFAEASTAPTADFDLFVTLPPGLTALAGGKYLGGGHWQLAGARDVAISVGRFTLAGTTVNVPEPVEVTVGVAAGINESPTMYLNKATKVLADFSRRYGSYPWPTYTLAITPNLSGGIEYPMHVMQGPGTIGRTTSHEIGHMWFFGLVGNDQGRDPWLDEGLATFAEGRYEGTLASMKARSIPADARGRAGDPMTYWEGHQKSYYPGVYVQGAQAMAALGDADRVDCALRHFVARSANTIARNRDVIAALEPSFPNTRAVLARYGIRG